MTALSNHPATCACCRGTGASKPLAVYNRPGLAAVAYRAGTYSTFRRDLQSKLSDARWPALRQLRTRDNDDFTIALLDAWAMTGDVLTFYSERIANESYLRTARERLSIVEQSRLIGYQLAPGLAASTHLVFTMEDSPGAPEQAAQAITLAPGTRAQSIPGPDEDPQIFETSEAIEARPEWNAISAQLTEPQVLRPNTTLLWLAGSNVNLAPGDLLLLFARSGGEMKAATRRVVRVRPDAAGNRTGIVLDTSSPAVSTTLVDDPGVWALRVSASPFGHNAPRQAQYSDGKFEGFQEWDLAGADTGTNSITLSARYEKILVGSFLVIEQDDPVNYGRIFTFAKVQRVTHLSASRYGIAGSATDMGLSAHWQKTEDSNLSLLRSMSIGAQSEELAVAAQPLRYPVYGPDLALNSNVEGLLPGRPIAISGKRQRVRITKRATDPMLELDSGETVPLKADDILTFSRRPGRMIDGTAYLISPEVFGDVLEEQPPPTLRLKLIDRDGQTGTVILEADGIALEPAADPDATIGEIVFISSAPEEAIVHTRDRTVLTLSKPLTTVYDRATVRINANVAAATNGESISEVLGSGDATLPYQRFTLRQSPLTFVSADTPTGSESTLAIYVNDVLWKEAPYFYGRSATERIYITRRDSEGRTSVQFGDGVTGARLPTGQNNVRARYRKGSGLSGLVQAGQISQLLSRPLGLKEVVNREAPTGAEDSEVLDDARVNAPLTVLTLDRAVSLQDYEDFSRGFAGIAKAQAVWAWDGRRRTVFVTVAGTGGATVEEDGAVMTRLKEALRAYGDPYVGFTIRNFRKVMFQIRGTLFVHPDYVSDTVLSTAASLLRERYGFEARAFGQPAALSEAIAVLQSTPGVVSVDVDMFYRNDAPDPPLKPRLDAASPAMGADGVLSAAELLLVDETSFHWLVTAQ